MTLLQAQHVHRIHTKMSKEALLGYADELHKEPSLEQNIATYYQILGMESN